MDVNSSEHTDMKSLSLCAGCVEHPDRPCRSCAARRRAALRLEQDGLKVGEIAQRMGLSELRVLRLLEQAHDRHRLHRFNDGEIDVRSVQELFARWRERDEQHTYAELARLAGYASTSRVQRLLGELATSQVVKGEIVYPGRILTTISTENAGRLVRAMGHTPAEIAGL
jgi:AraC-like DNA-binding protein